MVGRRTGNGALFNFPSLLGSWGVFNHLALSIVLSLRDGGREPQTAGFGLIHDLEHAGVHTEVDFVVEHAMAVVENLPVGLHVGSNLRVFGEFGIEGRDELLLEVG